MSGEVGESAGPAMTGADVIRAALHLALLPGPRCRSGRVGPADQIEDYTLARTRGAGPLSESAVLTTDCRINREAPGLSQMRLTIGRIVAAPAADGTPAEGDDA
jgi:hypothetical protein